MTRAVLDVRKWNEDHLVGRPTLGVLRTFPILAGRPSPSTRREEAMLTEIRQAPPGGSQFSQMMPRFSPAAGVARLFHKSGSSGASFIGYPTCSSRAVLIMPFEP
jgi:hypothetical protein